MSESTKPPTLDAAIGRRVRQLREEQGLGQDAAATGLRRLGLNLSRSALAKVERGERSTTFEDRVLLALYFRVPLADLLPRGEDVAKVRLSEQTSVSVEHLRAVLAGETPDFPGFETPMQREDIPRIMQEVDQYTHHIGRLWPRVHVGVVLKAERAVSGEAEQRAAERLGVKPIDVAIGAQLLWDRPLAEERDARVVTEGKSAAEVQALRGHVTRQLLDELRAELDKRMRARRRRKR